MIKIKNTETFYQLHKSPDFLRNSSFPKEKFISKPLEYFTDGEHETCTGGEQVCTGIKGNKFFPLKCEVKPRVCVPESAHLNKHFEEKEVEKQNKEEISKINERILEIKDAHERKKEEKKELNKSNLRVTVAQEKQQQAQQQKEKEKQNMGKLKKIQEIKENQEVKLKDQKQKLKDKARERLSMVGTEVNNFVFNIMKKYLEPVVFKEVKPVALKYASYSETRTVKEALNKAKEVIMYKKAVTIRKGLEALNNSKFSEIIEKLATLIELDEDLKKGTLSSLQYAPRLQFRRVRDAIIETVINEIVNEARKTEGWGGRLFSYCSIM